RYPYLLCFHVSKSGYTYPPAGNPVIPGLYLAGIKPANLFRNYLNRKRAAINWIYAGCATRFVLFYQKLFSFFKGIFTQKIDRINRIKKKNCLSL
ncbi:MAG TPA: hypothetical protein H9968_01085, partial [Candidatus Anaerobutyricum stercoris]|nr:hypothetical protein [Candidatus Anaerobutyricum stercoris]